MRRSSILKARLVREQRAALATLATNIGAAAPAPGPRKLRGGEEEPSPSPPPPPPSAPSPPSPAAATPPPSSAAPQPSPPPSASASVDSHAPELESAEAAAARGWKWSLQESPAASAGTTRAAHDRVAYDLYLAAREATEAAAERAIVQVRCRRPGAWEGRTSVAQFAPVEPLAASWVIENFGEAFASRCSGRGGTGWEHVPVASRAAPVAAPPSSSPPTGPFGSTLVAGEGAGSAAAAAWYPQPAAGRPGACASAGMASALAHVGARDAAGFGFDARVAALALEPAADALKQLAVFVNDSVGGWRARRLRAPVDALAVGGGGEVCVLQLEDALGGRGHALALASGVVFDANATGPLPLCARTLDACTPGGTGFRRVVRGYAFARA